MTKSQIELSLLGILNLSLTLSLTLLRLRHGWLYLVAIIDWYSRYVVAWELSETLELPFVLTAARRALATAVPAIWNHDQGRHFTSPQ